MRNKKYGKIQSCYNLDGNKSDATLNTNFILSQITIEYKAHMPKYVLKIRTQRLILSKNA